MQSVIYTTPVTLCHVFRRILLVRHPRFIIGENQNIPGRRGSCSRVAGVAVEVLQDPRALSLMRQFIAQHPSLWNEDIARMDVQCGLRLWLQQAAPPPHGAAHRRGATILPA